MQDLVISSRSFGFMFKDNFVSGTLYRNTPQKPDIDAYLTVNGVDYSTIKDYTDDAEFVPALIKLLKTP